MKIRFPLMACLSLVAALPMAAIAQVANGSFETGDLSGWTTGGTNRVVVAQNVNFRVGGNAAPMPAVPDGSRFAVLSTGPGSISGSGSNIDGNGANDYDAATLRGTISFSGQPAYLVFDWNFASSEPDANPPYDDFFDVRINNLRVFSRSANANTSNTSPFPDAPSTGYGVVNWSMNVGVLNGVSLTRGVGAWQRTCFVIPYTSSGSYNLPLEFRIADQADNTVDSVLLIDNIRVQEACDPVAGSTLEQITATSGSTVETKGGGFVFRQADQRLAVANRNFSTAQVRAFISSANLDGSNPNLVEQIFLRRNGVNERVDFAVAAGGRIQAIDLSDNGDFLAFSARVNAADNLEVYRYRLSNGQLTQLTNTSGCSNENPVVSNSGTVVAFESTCNAVTGYGSTRKVVYRTMTTAGGSLSSPFPIPAIAGCPSQDPVITGTGRFIGLSSTCNPPGRSNTEGRQELFVFDNDSNQAGTSSRWRQVTNSAAGVLNYGLSLSQGGTGFTNNYATFISTGNLASNNGDGSPEVFRWRGNNTTSNNGTVTQVTNETAAGNYYINVVRGLSSSDTAYFTFERVNLLTGEIEIGYGSTGTSGGGTNVVAAGSNFLGLGFAENNNYVYVPFTAAHNFNGGNGDGNYEVWEARADK